MVVYAPVLIVKGLLYFRPLYDDNIYKYIVSLVTRGLQGTGTRLGLMKTGTGS